MEGCPAVSAAEDAPDVEATWFVDPPYQGGCGRLYRYKFDDYERLADWCRDRRGQVIVCERQGASWLPFRTLGTFKSTEGSRGKAVSHEVIWTNDPTPCPVFS